MPYINREDVLRNLYGVLQKASKLKIEAHQGGDKALDANMMKVMDWLEGLRSNIEELKVVDETSKLSSVRASGQEVNYGRRPRSDRGKPRGRRTTPAVGESEG